MRTLQRAAQITTDPDVPPARLYQNPQVVETTRWVVSGTNTHNTISDEECHFFAQAWMREILTTTRQMRSLHIGRAPHRALSRGQTTI